MNYLVFEQRITRRGRVSQPQGSVRIAATLRSVLRAWKASTRISPIFPLEKGADPDLDTATAILFVGPLPVDEVPQYVRKACPLWLSYGAYNIVLVVPSRAALEKAQRWIDTSTFRFELWSLRRGTVRAVQYSAPTTSDGAESTILSTPLESDSKINQFIVEEYEALIASAVQRARDVVPAWVVELETLHAHVSSEVADAHSNQATSIDHSVFSEVAPVNAALSRMSSQALSGYSPIEQTESHFWTHSLLGTGLANIGLWRLTRFIFDFLDTFGYWRRIRNYNFTRTATQGDSAINMVRGDDNDDHWDRPNLDRTEPVELGRDDEELILGPAPIITFFSGRDLFRATTRTLSAPTACVEASTTRSWTLHTLTHEISHVLVEASLGHLYPETRAEVARLRPALRKDRVPKTLADEIRRLFLFAVGLMEQVEEERDFFPTDPDSLTALLKEWKHDVEETLVAVVDYLHFYSNRDEALLKYLKAEWTSWGVLPGIHNRLEEYLVRSACVALIDVQRSLRSWEALAVKSVERALEELGTAAGPENRYATEALTLLRKRRKRLIEKVAARRRLVRFAQGYLFSHAMAVALATPDPAPPRRQPTRRNPAEFFSHPAQNLLLLVERMTTSAYPDPRRSLLLFYRLAFSRGGSRGTA